MGMIWTIMLNILSNYVTLISSLSFTFKKKLNCIFLNVKGKIVRKLALSLSKMPVTTRNQIKTKTFVPELSNLVTHQSTTKSKMIISSSLLEANDKILYGNSFVSTIKLLLAQCENAVGKQEKIKVVLQIMNIINSSLLIMLEYYKNPTWIKFAATVYIKTIEFETQGSIKNFYDNVEPELVRVFTESYLKVRNMLSEFFKKIRHSTNSVNLSESIYVEIYKHIDKLNNTLGSRKLRRNIPVVSYVGMDFVEPESEFDGINNPWADTSIYYDSDYIPEDEDSDEDDNEHDNEDEIVKKNTFVKFKPTNANLRSEYVRKLRSYNSAKK